MNYKDLPKGTTLFNYDDLSDYAKMIAREQVMSEDLKNHRNDIDGYWVLIKTNVHICIDKSRTHYKSLLRRKKHIKRTMSDRAYLERYIVGNACQFTKRGEYITFCT